MAMIVARNYRDPESPRKWLVRQVDQTAEEAIACRAVLGRFNEIVPARESERLNGCWPMVVRCGNADVFGAEGDESENEPPGHGALIHFDRYRFANERSQSIYRCDRLVFMSDGNMRYL